MSIDASTLPISPMVIITAGAYCLLMLLIAGPEMSDRAIARSSWAEDCDAALTADLEASRAPKRTIPRGMTGADLLCRAYPEFQILCDGIPDPNAALRAAELRKQRAEEARIQNAARGIGEACSCATVAYSEKERVQLALWAGSGRAYTPRAVSHRTEALTRAVKSPACALDLGVN
ncbi:MAG: hypothetical protein AAF092_10055 [Pseudomonadota bacterium]